MNGVLLCLSVCLSVSPVVCERGLVLLRRLEIIGNSSVGLSSKLESSGTHVYGKYCLLHTWRRSFLGS
jgi:hypothetical protein